MPHVAVFDTNILFSALGWQGKPFRCLQQARTGKALSVTCSEILAELEEKLQLKRGMSAVETAKVVHEILTFSQLVTITGTLKIVSADPDDDAVVECALNGGATHIVTGDRHLLTLGSYQGISIVSAADFLAVVPAP